MSGSLYRVWVLLRLAPVWVSLVGGSRLPYYSYTLFTFPLSPIPTVPLASRFQSSPPRFVNPAYDTRTTRLKLYLPTPAPRALYYQSRALHSLCTRRPTPETVSLYNSDIHLSNTRHTISTYLHNPFRIYQSPRYTSATESPPPPPKSTPPYSSSSNSIFPASGCSPVVRFFFVPARSFRIVF